MGIQVSEKFDLVYHEAYCFITWIPENIPAFAKARVSTHQVKNGNNVGVTLFVMPILSSRKGVNSTKQIFTEQLLQGRLKGVVLTSIQ